MTNPDPEPSESTGLEPGGGVPPGETPPDSGSVSPGPVGAGPGRRTKAPWLIVGVLFVVALALAVFFVGRLA